MISQPGPPGPPGPPGLPGSPGSMVNDGQFHLFYEAPLWVVSNWQCVRLIFPGPAWDAWSKGELVPNCPDCLGDMKMLEVGPECQCVLLQGEPGYGMKGEKGDGGAPGAPVSDSQELLLFWCLWCEQRWRCSVPAGIARPPGSPWLSRVSRSARIEGRKGSHFNRYVFVTVGSWMKKNTCCVFSINVFSFDSFRDDQESLD